MQKLNWVEPVPIPDCYADGVAEVQNLGGVNFRMVYFVWQRGPGGILERACVARIVRPVDSVLGYPSNIARILRDATPLVPQHEPTH